MYLALITGFIDSNPESGAEITTCQVERVSDNTAYQGHSRITVAVKASSSGARFAELMVAAWDQTPYPIGNYHLIVPISQNVRAHTIIVAGDQGRIAYLNCAVVYTADEERKKLWAHPFSGEPVNPRTPN